jgi:hypothetical protein
MVSDSHSIPQGRGAYAPPLTPGGLSAAVGKQAAR